MVPEFSPLDVMVDSDWIYPFPIPKSSLSRAEQKSIKKAARADRIAFSRLSKGEKTPTLLRYEASCHEAQKRVQARHLEHQTHIENERFRCQAILTAEPPSLIKPLRGAPPADPIERQEWFNHQREAARSAEALRLYEQETRQAEQRFKECLVTERALAYFASTAFDLWARFYEELCQRHLAHALRGSTPGEFPRFVLPELPVSQAPEPKSLSDQIHISKAIDTGPLRATDAPATTNTEKGNEE